MERYFFLNLGFHFFSSNLNNISFFQDVYINTPGNIGRSKCPLCNGEFTYRKGMIEHLQVVHGEHLISEMMKCTGDEKDRLCSDMRFK